MGYFTQIQDMGHEQVVFCQDTASGLKAIIGIHNTTLGPALGGCRMKIYASEEDALNDVLRLSQAMTLKSSLAGLDLGGGKTVVILESPDQKTPALLRALAHRIDALKGTYIGAGDIGSNTHDLKLMRQVTPWVTGLAKEDGGLGDSAILTSLGVFMGLKAAVMEQFSDDRLTGIKVGVQGAGKVGYHLIQHLYRAGCQIWVSDPQPEALERVKHHFPLVTVVSPEALLDRDLDIFSPNAVGGVVTADLARQLAVRIVAGGANNILADGQAGQILKEHGILYAPDFALNAGGVIMVACEIQQQGFEAAREKTEAIYDQLLAIFRLAREADLTPHEAAVRLAWQRIEAAQKARRHETTLRGRKTPKVLRYPGHPKSAQNVSS